MTVLVVTITDPSPAFDKKSAEIAYIQRVLDTLLKELAGARGTVTSGTIRGQSAGGVNNSALGSWTYTPAASNP
jgi:hypothetical protein